MGMLFAAGGLTNMASTYLVSHYAFTDAHQLKQFESLDEEVSGK